MDRLEAAGIQQHRQQQQVALPAAVWQGKLLSSSEGGRRRGKALLCKPKSEAHNVRWA